MGATQLSNLTREKLREMFLEGKRFDGRSLDELRKIEISYNVSNKAEGSARVRAGKTDIVIGIKLEVGEPYPDSPDKGNLMVSGDLLPLASPRFESGPPGFDAIELPRLVDRAIRESGMIDFKKLVIEEGKKVWTVIIDVYPINDDGNLIDLATIGAVAALKKTYFPALDENGKIDYKNKTNKQLPLSEITPISFSFFKIGSSLILDPTREEQEASDARVTFGISLLNGEHMLNSCQKKGEAIITDEEIYKMMEIITNKFDELYKKLKSHL